jgi:hypothetical protein
MCIVGIFSSVYPNHYILSVRAFTHSTGVHLWSPSPSCASHISFFRLWSRFQALINSYYHLSPGRMLPLVIRPMTMSRHTQLKALANTACLYGPAPLYHNLLSLHRRSYLYILPLIYFVPFPRKRGRTCFLYSPQTASNRGGHSSRS